MVISIIKEKKKKVQHNLVEEDSIQKDKHAKAVRTKTARAKRPTQQQPVHYQPAGSSCMAMSTITSYSMDNGRGADG